MLPFLRPFFRKLALRRGVKQLPAGLAAGDLCSIRTGKGSTYRIAKVLVRASGAIHVRLYKEVFNWRPQVADSATLSLGTIHDPDGCGIGHLPITEGEFGLWEPVIIRREAVTPQELDGYEIWRDAKGGVWNA